VSSPFLKRKDPASGRSRAEGLSRCRFCGKEFIDENYLKKHKEEVHGISQYLS